MRRKSERTSKKSKASPEVKPEPVKRSRTSRRRKQSSSSDNEEDKNIAKNESDNITLINLKDESSEEKQEQVWQVKASESSNDSGEIKKLKICLARPLATPESAESPKSKRKHHRTPSSSDTPNSEASDDKRKTRHKSKKGVRDLKDDFEKITYDSQEDTETDPVRPCSPKTVEEITKTITVTANDNVPMSTTSDDSNVIVTIGSETVPPTDNSQDLVIEIVVDDQKQSIPDTTVDSSSVIESVKSPETVETQNEVQVEETAETQDKSNLTLEPEPDTRVFNNTVIENVELSVTEQPEDAKPNESCVEDQFQKEKSETNVEICKNDIVLGQVRETAKINDEKTDKRNSDETVEILSFQVEPSEKAAILEESFTKPEIESKVVESHNEVNTKQKTRKKSSSDADDLNGSNNRKYSRSDSSQSKEELQNGPPTPFLVSRKRRWGSRPNKETTHKSMTISTDILKDIIPDVKPVELEEVIDDRKHRKVEEKIERPVLPKIVIDNTENVEQYQKNRDEEKENNKDSHLLSNRKISILKDDKENDSIIATPPSPPRHKTSSILYITNLVRPFTLPQLKNLLQRTGKIVEDGFWIDKIKSKCFVKYDTEDQAVETRHALHGVTWPVSNPKTLNVDFSNQEDFDKALSNQDTNNSQVSTIPGTVEDWLREQDLKREQGVAVNEKPWERRAPVREWDVGKGDKDKERHLDERPDRRRHREPERSPEPAKKFKKKEEEAPAKLLDDLFRKTKTTPCIYWLPLSAETIAIKEEQRRQHMAEHERRMQEFRRSHRGRH